MTSFGFMIRSLSCSPAPPSGPWSSRISSRDARDDRFLSDGVLAPLPRADADGLLDGDDEDLPVADPPGLGALLDGVDDVVDEVIGDDDVDLHLGHEVHDVGRPTV